ncbi:MAG: putative DNA-binding domain-containing protein [Betaproteobacteria bacterium]|nr:putative DNA-binding domain-containing protein [Betaproteobacteria bacterium]
MPALSNDQADFARAIVLGLDLSPQAHAVCPKYRVATAMAVYHNNYRGNLHDTLASAYPVTEQLVGKDFFRVLTKQFIEQYPSRSGNLHHYGAEMADFIADFEPAQSLVYLSDVAALEWACHRAYFAEDEATLDVSGLSKVPAENYADLVIHTHPACHMVRSIYPIAAIWNAHQPGANSDFHIDLDSGSSNALVSRKENTVMVTELTEAGATWLQSIRSGAPLGEATSGVLERYPDFNLNTALLNLLEQGVLADFTLENMP